MPGPSSLYEGGMVSTTAGADEFISNDIIITGNVYYVYSVSGSDSNDGSENYPLATLSAAQALATDNNGDVIIVKSGHTETISSAITISKAVKYYGLGTGSSRPKFTCAAAIKLFDVSARGVEINNFYFPKGTTTGNTARIDAYAGLKIKNCYFECGQYDQNTILVPATSYNVVIDSCSFVVVENGPDSAIKPTSTDVLELNIKNCSFNGASIDWDDAAIYSAVAHVNFEYENNTLTGNARMHHNTASTGWCSGTIAGDNCKVKV